ncbi:MAG: FAD-dependent oxidoreductase [Steroidobacteraceae bacterium]
MEDIRTVIIVGGGQAGGRAAKAVRAAGYAGRLILIGAETHLPYERPALSKAVLLDDSAMPPAVLVAADREALDMQVRTGCAVAAIDRGAREVQLADGARLAYDRLLLATGSRIRTLAIEGVAAETIWTLRTLDDSRRLRERLRARADVAIVGGGFIGLEVAASAAKLGCRVTVIEAADRLLPRLGCPEASSSVLAYHRSIGIDVRLGATVVRGDATGLVLSDGSRIPATLIVAGIGVAPETALAEAAGLECRDGVLVDEHGRTSDPAIFAAGDVTRHYHPVLGRHIRLESWQNANVQAEAAARSMIGIATASAEIPWLWSDQGDLNLQVAGAPQAIDRVVVRGDPAGEGGFAVFQFQGEHLVGGVTINRGKDMPMIRRMLARPDLKLDAAALADPETPLRRLLPAREAA